MQNAPTKKRPTVKGKIDEIIYAQVGYGEDLLHAIWDVCKENDVKTGVLLDATGCMKNLRVHAIAAEPGQPAGIHYEDVPGCLEVSAHGIIGMGWVDKSIKAEDIPGLIRSSYDTGFGAAGFVEHGSPYAHIHIVGSSPKRTICGHLIEGSFTATQYFELIIAKVSGVLLKAKYDSRGYPDGYTHELVQEHRP